MSKNKPRCGVDFCDECGDCLACYGDDVCSNGGKHSWVIKMERVIIYNDTELWTILDQVNAVLKDRELMFVDVSNSDEDRMVYELVEIDWEK